MKVTRAKFLLSAANDGQCPRDDLPQIAFSGKSNVGKSSLINSLTGRKGLVKVSKTPGKTRLINFFKINESLLFVDMPGYGFANVSLKLKETWGAMVENYLNHSGALRGVVQLLDCRRTPSADDLQALDWFYQAGIPVVIVFTKIDKIPKTKRAQIIKKACLVIPDHIGARSNPIAYSASSSEGKKELWAAIQKLCSTSATA